MEHTHPDAPALDVLSSLFNGFGGSLFEEIRSRQVSLLLSLPLTPPGSSALRQRWGSRQLCRGGGPGQISAGYPRDVSGAGDQSAHHDTDRVEMGVCESLSPALSV